MIQFFVQKILAKTKHIIEQFDYDPTVQNIVFGLRITPVEELAFLQRYFPNATEELFRNKPEIKKKYLAALKTWFDEKRRLGGGGAVGVAFARRLLLPVRADENSLFSYSRQNDLEWNRFAVAFASAIKGPASMVVKTKQGTNEVITHTDMKDLQFDEVVEKNDDGKISVVSFEEDDSEKVELKTTAEIEEEMKLKFQAKVKIELEQAGLFVEHLEIQKEFGAWKAVGRTRDRFGKETFFETQDQPFENSREYQFSDMERPNENIAIGIFELPAIRGGMAQLFARRRPEVRGIAFSGGKAASVRNVESARRVSTGEGIDSKMAGMQAAREKFEQKKKYQPDVSTRAPQSGASRQTPQFSGMPFKTPSGAPKKKSGFGKMVASGIGGAAAFFGATFGGGFFFS